MNKPEILAPGGSIEAVHAAINAGCDAIYMGGKRFGARAFADNPDNDKLLKVMDDIHLHGKKIYLTVNTVLTEKEFTPLYDYIDEVYRNGVDAVIVQDFGVLLFISREFPGLAIHASTQMSLLQGMAANELKKYNVTRIVPARELTLEEIGKINEATEAEIEVFVHGALCCSMSGQCLMSSLIGGRSGNRGACAQPCRKQYSYNGGKREYFLSPKDLCAIDYIPSLVDMGVDSFKIEGRMKKPEYVAITTGMYRKYTDILFDKGKEYYDALISGSKEYEEDMTALKDIYNRGGFTKGYLIDKRVTKELFTPKRCNHAGVKVGSMKTADIISFEKPVNAGDVLEIRNEEEAGVHEHTLGHIGSRKELRINAGYHQKDIRKNYHVYRIRNSKLIDELKEKYPEELPKLKIEGIFRAFLGEKCSLTVKHGDITATVYGDIVERAQKNPATKEEIRSKVMVSGDSEFEWNKLDIRICQDAFLPASKQKKLRRDAMALLREMLLADYRREHTGQCKERTLCANSKKEEYIAECRNEEQFDIVNNSEIIDVIYYHIEDCDKETLNNITSKAKKPIYFALPRVARTHITELFDARYDVENLVKNEWVKGLLVSSLEEIIWVKQQKYVEKVEIRTADNVHVRNTYAYEWLIACGVSHVSLSVEAADDEYDSFKGLDTDMLVYGKPSAMILLNHYDCSGTVSDEYGNIYDIISHKDYTELLNYEAIDKLKDVKRYDGIGKRMSFTDEGADEVKKILRRCKRR